MFISLKTGVEDYYLILSSETIKLGLTEPMNFGNGAIYTNRWYRDPLAVFATKVNNKLVGFSMVANWGTCDGFGAIMVHSDDWYQVLLCIKAISKYVYQLTKKLGYPVS